MVWFEYFVGPILNRQCRALNNLERVTTECLRDSMPPCNKMLPSVNMFSCDLGYLLKASCLEFFLRILSSMKETNKQVYQRHRDFCNRKLVLEHLQHEVKRRLATESRGQLEERQDSCLDAPQCRYIIRKTNNGRVWYYIPVLVCFLNCLFVFYFFPSVWKNLTKSCWVQIYVQSKAAVRVCLHCTYCVT